MSYMKNFWELLGKVFSFLKKEQQKEMPFLAMVEVLCRYVIQASGMISLPVSEPSQHERIQKRELDLQLLDKLTLRSSQLLDFWLCLTTYLSVFKPIGVGFFIAYS